MFSLVLNLYKLLLNPLTTIRGYLDPYFNRLSSNGYNLRVLWIINLGSKPFSSCIQINAYKTYSITIETLRNTSYVIASLTILADAIVRFWISYCHFHMLQYTEIGPPSNE